jgi:hypothetical protein
MLPSQHYGELLDIFSNYNLPKEVIAIFQTVYAAITLYRSRGSQIEVFGYAAFGLTVTPYIVMSIINLFAQIATPDYDSLLLVKSDIITKAERRGGVFDGAIGELVHEPIAQRDPRSFNAIVRQEGNSDFFQLETPGGYLVPDSETGPSAVSLPMIATGIPEPIWKFFPFRPKEHNNKLEARKYKEWLYIPSCTPFRRSCTVTDGTVRVPQDSRKYLSKNLPDDKAEKGYLEDKLPERRHWVFFQAVIPLTLSLVSIVVDGILSGFGKGESTKAQRGWIMSWLIVGMAVAGLGGGLISMFADLLWDAWSKEREENSALCVILILVMRLLFIQVMVGFLFAPAVGGLVVVSQMNKQYGNCIRTH